MTAEEDDAKRDAEIAAAEEALDAAERAYVTADDDAAAAAATVMAKAQRRLDRLTAEPEI